jgi:hypothetical protein
MNPSAFDAPNHSRSFEDYVPGSIFEFGTSSLDGTVVHFAIHHFVAPPLVRLFEAVSRVFPEGGQAVAASDSGLPAFWS